MLDRLYDIKTVAYDKSVTLESIQLDERLLDKIKEINPKKYLKKVSDSFKSFLEGLKKEGKETKDAYALLVDSVKNNKKLTKEERKQIGDQLKDTLKLAGFTAASILPGGIIYILLAKTTKLKKHMLPSAFLEESK